MFEPLELVESESSDSFYPKMTHFIRKMKGKSSKTQKENSGKMMAVFDKYLVAGGG